MGSDDARVQDSSVFPLLRLVKAVYFDSKDSAC